MWKIGNIEINGKVVLAPMAGITTHGYRKFMIPFGVDVAYSEMVSDMGLIYGNIETEGYVKFDKEECPIGIQLFGSDPKNIAKAALICEKMNQNFDFFDVNMGCPVPKVTNSGAGSALMKNPINCGDIIRELKKVTDKPITAKIRLGWDNKSLNYKEVIRELEDAGVSAIAIHARTKKDLYGGLPRWELLRNLKDEMKVPLIVSGNIYTLDDAITTLEITKADAVMIARGGMGNPYLIKQINTYFSTGEKLPNPSVDDQIDYCLQLGKVFIEDKGDIVGPKMLRTIAPRFFSGFPNSKNTRVRLVTELDSYESLVKILKDYKIESN